MSDDIDYPADVPHDETRVPFEVGDRVLIIQTGELGRIIGTAPDGLEVVVDGPQPWVFVYSDQELEHSDAPGGEPVTPDETAPARPPRDGLPGVGDALLQLAEILGAQLPDNPVVQGKLVELKTAVESAMPANTIDDGFGNGWVLCGPGCDLEVVRPGKVQCSGRVCGEAVDPGPDPRNADEIEEAS